MILGTAPDPYRKANGKRAHDSRRTHHAVGTDDFICVDGEGMTIAGEHRYVLLGAGQEQIDDPDGLHWRDILEFLYEQYQPRVAFTGFYLGYDFTQWLKTMPEDRVRSLITIDGREARRSKSPAMHGRFLPVDLEDWQIDLLGSKRFAFRRKPCECLTVKCPHDKGPWMYICDSGGFFQTSFLNVIDPKNWQTPIITPEEYATILEGKERRETAVLDRDMRRYNLLENEVLARVLRDLNEGFKRLDVHLSPKQWFGPGQAAQSWMKGRAPKRTELIAPTVKHGALTHNPVPQWFLDAAVASYFGGWFELQAHGIIPGVCHENDINNAYPYIISRLPCLLHGSYSRGTGRPPALEEGEIRLVRCMVWTSPPHSPPRHGAGLGAMLHRDKQGRICRPLVTAGWYWQHELEAAQRAKCVTRVAADRYYEWVSYKPCPCQPPLWQVKNLYQIRLDVGKKSSLGKSAKLVNNSIYGKTAQSIGAPLFANPIYASLITSGCRTMILDAIATHPGGKSNVVMVATDAVFFLDPHPLLAYGPGLGEWETKPRTRLTLFKPGVYWDDEAREAIRAGSHPNFKARGISARDFSKVIAEVDEKFASWGDNPPSINDATFTPEELEAMGLPAWPKVKFRSNFAMTTALQALVRNDWATAGVVEQGKPLVQNANPEDKRTNLWLDRSDPARPIYRSEPLPAGPNATWRHDGNRAYWDAILVETFDSVPYEKRFGMDDPFSDEVQQAYGVSPDEHRPLLGAFRILTRQE